MGIRQKGTYWAKASAVLPSGWPPLGEDNYSEVLKRLEAEMEVAAAQDYQAYWRLWWTYVAALTAERCEHHHPHFSQGAPRVLEDAARAAQYGGPP